jgi:predicted transcriptional regulator
MQPSVLEMAKDLVKAQIEAGQLSPDAMSKALQESHASLMALQTRQVQVEAGEGSGVGNPPGSIDWRQSITRHAITCLECRASFKQLSVRHLRQHDLEARSYRSKYGIPRTQPLAARDTTARRRQVVQAVRPWEKTRKYLAMQAGTAAKKKTGAKRSRKTSSR